MTWEQLATFNIALLVATASPGPALVMATHTSASKGRAAGIAAGAGLGVMAATWTMMALLGLVVIFELFPMLYIGAKILGGAYLMYLAYKMWRHASAPINTRTPAVRHAFRQGFLVNLLNPKSLLFSAAILVAVFPAGISVVDTLVIVINHFLVEAAFYTILSFCMSTQAVSERYIRAKTLIDRGAAVVLGTLGVRLILSQAEAP